MLTRTEDVYVDVIDRSQAANAQSAETVNLILVGDQYEIGAGTVQDLPIAGFVQEIEDDPTTALLRDLDFSFTDEINYLDMAEPEPFRDMNTLSDGQQYHAEAPLDANGLRQEVEDLKRRLDEQERQLLGVLGDNERLKAQNEEQGSLLSELQDLLVNFANRLNASSRLTELSGATVQNAGALSVVDAGSSTATALECLASPENASGRASGSKRAGKRARGTTRDSGYESRISDL